MTHCDDDERHIHATLRLLSTYLHFQQRHLNYNNAPLTMEGRCQCSQIRFTTPLAKPIALYICHCTECRHQSSSAFGMTALFPAFDIPEPYLGAIAVYSRPTSKGGRSDGYFCTKCGSRLVHHLVSNDGVPTSALSVRIGCLEGVTKEMTQSAVHIWTKSAIVNIPGDAEAYEEGPPGGSIK